MNLLKSPDQLVLQEYVPTVLLLTSPGAEKIAARNGLTVAQMLHPFTMMPTHGLCVCMKDTRLGF